MLNPADIVDAMVAKLRAIPELVQEIGEDPDNIVAFHNRWPYANYLQTALVEMKAPGILVVWRETSPGGFGAADAWKHTCSLIIRPKEESVDLVQGDASAYGRIFGLIINGVPKDSTAGGQKLLNETIHSGCYPMEPPTFSRQTLMVSPEASLDYFEMRITLTESGDN